MSFLIGQKLRSFLQYQFPFLVVTKFRVKCTDSCLRNWSAFGLQVASLLPSRKRSRIPPLEGFVLVGKTNPLCYCNCSDPGIPISETAKSLLRFIVLWIDFPIVPKILTYYFERTPTPSHLTLLKTFR